MTLEERIEAAGKAIFDADNALDGDTIGTIIHENFRIDPIGDDKGIGETMVVCRAAATAAIRAAFPELFTAPPTAWIAPWERTEAMRLASVRTAVVEEKWAAMRDSHLSTLKGEKP